MFYLVQKPYWISSNLVIKILKRVFDVDKIGFAGTLDPLATGLMLVGTLWSARLFPMIEYFTKTYKTTIRLDGTTESYDLEKPIIHLHIPDDTVSTLTQEYIQNIIETDFLGNIMQSPPLYSAVWVDGTRSYERMRKGETDVTLVAKPRTIHAFTILSYDWPKLEAEITVSHGTYIRSIARDLGEKLHTGWYLESLERTSIGHLSIDTSKEWMQHNDIFYTPISHEAVFPDIPTLNLWESEKSHLRTGSTPIPTTQKNSLYFTDYGKEGYGLLEAKDGWLYPMKNCI